MKKILKSWANLSRVKEKIPSKKSLINVGWLFFDKIFRMATGMVIGVWLARYLGPKNYGLLNYANVFPLILAPLASLGINNILVSEIPTRKAEDINRIIRTAVNLRFVSGLIAFILITLVSYYINASDQYLIFLISISALSLIIQCFDTLDIYFQSIQKVHYVIIPKVSIFFLASIFRIYGLIENYHIDFFIIITITELLTSYLIIYVTYCFQNHSSIFSIVFDKTISKWLIKIAWPLMLSEFFVFIYMRIDQLMLKYLTNTEELGRYSAALRLSEVWYFIAGAITMSVYPSIIILRNSNYTDYLNRYQKLLNVLAIGGITIGLIFSIFSNEITSLVYGQKYLGISYILSIHIWTGLFVFIGIGTNNWFIVENMQRFLLWKTIIGAVINAILNYFLIPHYGAIGASVATLIAQVIASYLTNSISKKTREVFAMQTNAILYMPNIILSKFKQLI